MLDWTQYLICTMVGYQLKFEVVIDLTQLYAVVLCHFGTTAVILISTTCIVQTVSYIRIQIILVCPKSFSSTKDSNVVRPLFV